MPCEPSWTTQAAVTEHDVFAPGATDGDLQERYALCLGSAVLVLRELYATARGRRTLWVEDTFEEELEGYLARPLSRSPLRPGERPRTALLG